METLCGFVIYAGGCLTGFAVAAIVAEFVVPHIKPLEEWIKTLPMLAGKGEADEKEM